MIVYCTLDTSGMGVGNDWTDVKINDENYIDEQENEENDVDDVNEANDIDEVNEANNIDDDADNLNEDDEVNDIINTTNTPVDIFEINDEPTTTSTNIRSIKYDDFREMLIEHFDIMFTTNQIKWPTRNGSLEVEL